MARTQRPRINAGDFTGLKELGVSAGVLTLLGQARGLGSRFDNRSDLVKVGVPPAEADIIAANASFAADRNSKPQTIQLKVTASGGGADLMGYALSVERTEGPGSALLPLAEAGVVTYTFDAAVGGDTFHLAVKAPSGEFVPSRIDGGAAEQTHTITNAKFPKGVDVQTTALIGPAKSGPIALTRIKGRVISGDPKRSVEELQLLIEVSTKRPVPVSDDDFYPVGFATTETDGYFTTNQLVFQGANDHVSLTAARARIALSPAGILPIRLVPVGGLLGRLPERVILFLPGAHRDGSTDRPCDCDNCSDLNFLAKKVLDEFSYYTVVRTTEPIVEAFEIGDVDEIDLEDVLDDIPEDEVRGALAGLKVDRAALTSFLSRNRTISKANYQDLIAAAKSASLRKKLLDDRRRRPGRLPLDGTHAIDWDDRPTVYQAVSVAHGHLLHFKQEWFSDGYSIGDLLYSLPLAPGQQKQIVVFDWDRKESAANTQQLDYQESLYNALSRDRDVNEVARATLREHLEGSSSSTTSGLGFGAGIGAIIPIEVPIGALVGVAGGVGTGSSSAQQTGTRTTTASSQQQISDRTVQAATSIRSQRSTVIQTVSQGERFEVSSETIANYNHCHAMTVQYFEVLRHLELRTRLAEVQEALFVPLKLSAFTPEKALRWRDILQRCLRKRRLAPSFESLYRVEQEKESQSENYYASIGIPEGRFAQEQIEYVEGELSVEFQITRPRNKDDGDFLLDDWAPWIPFLGDPLEFFNRFLRNEANRDEAFARHAGPTVAQAVLDDLKVDALKNVSPLQSERLPIDATLLSNFRNRTRLNVSLRMAGPVGAVKREDIDFVKLSLDPSGPQLGKLSGLINGRGLRVIVHGGSLRYRTRNLHEHLFRSSNIRNDLTPNGDDVLIFCPLSDKALRQPRLEDVDLANDLLHHLNENLEYYHQCIWSRMDPQRRFILLDGILAPGRANGRSVASVVENRLIGIVGNCLVMPVAPGFRLDPILDEKVDLFEHYYEDPRDPIHISLPTKGVYAEAVMGQCNSCERKEEDRFWRWDEAPIPLTPTSINPVTVPIPQPSTPDLTPKDFPTPIINQQVGPTLPDPQGFGALLNLLGNANLFRDVTGLTENQKNALAAFQSSLQSAEAFGKEAAGLARSAAAMRLIQDAQRRGLLDNEKAQEKTEKAIDSAIPPSADEKLNTAQKQLDMISALEKGGELPSPDAQGARNRIIEGLTSQVLGTDTTSGDLAQLMERASTLNTEVKKEAGGFAIKPDSSTLVRILSVSLTPQLRAFGPKSDLSGKTKFSVRATNLSSSGSLRWSIPPTATGRYTITQKTLAGGVQEVEVSGIQPGLTEIDVQALEGGVVVESLKIPISIPQFVAVDDTTASFGTFLTNRNLTGIEANLRTELQLTAEQVLRDANVRLAWRSKSQSVPAHVGAAFTVTASIENDDVGRVHPRYGTTTHATVVGMTSFNENIQIFAESFFATDAIELNTATSDLVAELDAVQRSDPDLEQWFVAVIGRGIGESLAHEVYHTLLPDAFNHHVNAAGVDIDTGDLMDAGAFRDLTERTGVSLIQPISSAPGQILNNLADAGRAAIVGMVDATLLAHVRANFPVPPTPPFDK